jgi:spermidine synthase
VGDETPRRLVVAVAWVYALAGFSALAYEVAWTRLLSLFFDGTTYPFTIMLATVLAGIAIGSYVISPLLSRRLNWGLVFAGLEAALGLVALAGLWGFANLHALAAWAEARAGVLPLPPQDVVALVVSLGTIFPPAVVMGCAFPVAVRLYATAEARAGRQVGTIYAANVCGAVFGSYAAGFVLIPRLGAQGTVVALGGLNLALALLVLGLLARPVWPVRLALGLGGAAALLGLVWAAPDLRTRLLPERAAGAELVWHVEEAEATVSVVDVPGSGRLLYLNSRPQAHDAAGPVQLHRLLGHFPMLLHHAPRDVLAIGLGGGVTPGAVATYPGARVDVIELVPGVVDAARLFDHVNGSVVDRPAVRLRVDDGRNFLLRAAHAGRRYDVITADIIRPHHAGAANLYSREYYELAAAVLRDDGVMLQWLDPIPMHRHQLMVRTFLTAFPYATLWLNGDLLVGSKRPLVLDEAALAGRVADGRVDRTALAAAGIVDGPTLLQWYLARDGELRAYAGEGPALSDDRPTIEYFRSLPRDGTPLDIARFSRQR